MKRFIYIFLFGISYHLFAQITVTEIGNIPKRTSNNVVCENPTNDINRINKLRNLNILDTEIEDDYKFKLENEYHYIKQLYGLDSPMHHSHWKFSGVRPPSFPTVRLAQLAAVLFTEQRWFSYIQNENEIDQIRKRMQGSTSVFWKTHYNFGLASKETNKVLTEAFLDKIMINVMVPFLFYYGSFVQDESYKDRAFEILLSLKPESNAILKAWKKVGFSNKKLTIKGVLKGFIPFIASLLFTSLFAFYGWRFLLKIHPNYANILHGFTYNGYYYIAAFVALSIAVCFWFYKGFFKKRTAQDLITAPLFVWICINLGVTFYLPGAGFFIIPVFILLLLLAILLLGKQQNNLILFSNRNKN